MHKALQDVIKGYSGFRTVVNSYKLVEIFWNYFSRNKDKLL